MKKSQIELIPAQISFIKKYISSFNLKDWKLTIAGSAGSDRKFIRIKNKNNKESFILIIWDKTDPDWKRFINIQREVITIIPFLPKIYGYDEELSLILEEDLGNLTLKRYCYLPSTNKKRLEEIYKKVIDALIIWQKINPIASNTISQRTMDFEMFLWESNYFTRHCVLEFFGKSDLIKKEWEVERVNIAKAAAIFPQVCIHRDFQSENILISNNSIKFVDFQGARLGPAEYDLCSLLYDPYISIINNSLRKKLIDYYISKTSLIVDYSSIRICAIQRLMQALGAYANLYIHKGKERFLKYIPVALKRLQELAKQDPELPFLTTIVTECLKVKKN